MNRTHFASVIIPTMNEAKWIGATLDCVFAQVGENSDVEVLVVDTGSTDETLAIAASYPVTALQVDKRSPYVGRNLGIERTFSEYLLFLDARCRPQSGWLNAYRDCANLRWDYVAGRIESRVANPTLGGRLLAHRRSARARREDALAGNVPAGNMMISRKVFERIGRFDEERSGSDVRFSRRALASGFGIHYCDAAHVELQLDISTSAYLKRRYRIRRGQVRHGMGAPNLVAQLSELPWRPGWREARRMAPELDVGPLTAMFALWAERWAGFAGALAGHLGGSDRAEQ